MNQPNYQKGFTLVELIIAMAIGLFLLSGVGLIYSSLSQTTLQVKSIETNLEIIRFSSQIFTTSLKQTATVPTTLLKRELVIEQNAGLRSCQGVSEVNDFQEKYKVVDNFLVCEVDGTTVKLLKGVDSIEFTVDSGLVSIVLHAATLPLHLNGKVNIDIALTRVILEEGF